MKNRKFHFTFDPARRGVRKVLGDLEADIMEAVWRGGEVTVREVYDRLGPRRGIAYTTVMTVMSRLAAKGLLVQKREGTAFLYAASRSREEFATETAAQVIDELLADFAAPTMSRFVESVSGDADRIEELEKLLKEAKKQRARRGRIR